MCTDRKQFIHDLQKNMRNISFRNFAMRKKMKTKQFDYGISSILEQTHIKHSRADTLTNTYKRRTERMAKFCFVKEEKKKGEIVYHPLFYKIFND